jgi:hypothetical protein
MQQRSSRSRFLSAIYSLVKVWDKKVEVAWGRDQGPMKSGYTAAYVVHIQATEGALSV